MRTMWLIVAIMVAACGGDTTGPADNGNEDNPPPDPPDVAGMYVLDQVNGARMPASYPKDGCSEAAYTNGWLELTADSTTDGSIRREESCDGTGYTFTRSLGGTYSVKADSTISEDVQELTSMRYQSNRTIIAHYDRGANEPDTLLFTPAN